MMQLETLTRPHRGLSAGTDRPHTDATSALASLSCIIPRQNQEKHFEICYYLTLD